MDIPADVLANAEWIMGAAIGDEHLSATEGKIIAVDVETHLELLRQAENIARWILRIAHVPDCSTCGNPPSEHWGGACP